MNKRGKLNLAIVVAAHMTQYRQNSCITPVALVPSEEVSQDWSDSKTTDELSPPLSKKTSPRPFSYESLSVWLRVGLFS